MKELIMPAWRIKEIYDARNGYNDKYVSLKVIGRSIPDEDPVFVSKNNISSLAIHFRTSIGGLIGKVFGNNEPTAQIAIDVLLSNMVNAKNIT